MAGKPSDPFAGLDDNPVKRMIRESETAAAPSGNGRRKRSKTPYNRWRIANTWSGIIGEDLKNEIAALAERHDMSQGNMARSILLAGLHAYEDDDLELVKLVRRYGEGNRQDAA